MFMSGRERVTNKTTNVEPVSSYSPIVIMTEIVSNQPENPLNLTRKQNLESPFREVHLNIGSM